jgi:3-hydroxybutyryl-CoA dehydrogenase
MGIDKVGVLGCGIMGSGITQACAQAGFEVVVRDIEQRFIDKGLAIIDKKLSKAVKKNKLSSDDKDATLQRITGTLVLDDLQTCDLIIEAVVEDLALKNDMYATLDKMCSKDTIFASNTSSLPIISMAAETTRSDRFCGLHFFNPAEVMQLVEVVRTIATSKETVDACFEFVRQLGKTPTLAKDMSGFIVNKLLVPYLLDAMRSVQDGVASTADIDASMMFGCNHPMGPLFLSDFVGLDTILSIANNMYTEYREKKYAPPPLLVRLVQAGHYGHKSGKGFYDYSERDPEPVPL